jgi:hypothetical protein
VIPLSRGRGAGGGEVHIHISGQPLATSRDIQRAIVAALDEAASRGLRPRVA